MKILVAVDKSTYSQKAFASALEMAKQEKAQLSLITVFPDFIDMEEVAHKVKESLRASAEAVVEDAEKRAREQGVSVEKVVVGAASAADAIITHAKENGFDLIVMGHKSRPGLEQLLLGSVASKVVAYAPCSVLVVR